MTTELQGIARFKINEGKLEEYKRLCDECIEIVRTKDSGTLQYEIFFNEDQTECVVLERYRDSEALLEHFEHISHLMDAVLETVSGGGEILGEPNDEIKANLADGPVRLFTPWRTLES